MRGALLFAWSLAACKTPTPRATVTLGAPASPRAVLVLPTTCEVACEQRIAGGELTLGDEVDTLVRLKLELAGYTLAEASTLRLVTEDPEPSPGMPKTVVELPYDSVVDVATSLGLGGIVTTTVTSELRNYRTYLIVTVELRALPGRDSVWRAACGGFVTGGFARELTVQDLANCAGDGVLAVKAPDALFRRLP